MTNHLFLHHSFVVISFYQKLCLFPKRYVSCTWHPVLENCNKIKNVNSVGWLTLAHRVEEFVFGTMCAIFEITLLICKVCDNDSHSHTHWKENSSSSPPNFSIFYRSCVPCSVTKALFLLFPSRPFPSFFHQSDYKFWVDISIYPFKSLSSSPSFPTFPGSVLLWSYSPKDGSIHMIQLQ